MKKMYRLLINGKEFARADINHIGKALKIVYKNRLLFKNSDVVVLGEDEKILTVKSKKGNEHYEYSLVRFIKEGSCENFDTISLKFHIDEKGNIGKVLK